MRLVAARRLACASLFTVTWFNQHYSCFLLLSNTLDSSPAPSAGSRSFHPSPGRDGLTPFRVRGCVRKSKTDRQTDSPIAGWAMPQMSAHQPWLPASGRCVPDSSAELSSSSRGSLLQSSALFLGPPHFARPIVTPWLTACCATVWSRACFVSPGQETSCT